MAARFVMRRASAHELGAVRKFDASALFLSHEVVQTILGECLA
jgi:hypothetical protein